MPAREPASRHPGDTGAAPPEALPFAAVAATFGTLSKIAPQRCPLLPIQNLTLRAAGRVGRSLTDDASALRRRMLSIVKGEAAGLGLRVIDVLKHRGGDHKIVLLCESPRWGRCVLKSLPRGFGRGQFRNHVVTARLAREAPDGLFPKVHYIGENLCVEEWIEGPSLKNLPAGEWKDVDLLGFLRRLHAFSRGTATAESFLHPEELRVMLHSHLRQSFGFINYQGSKDRLATAARIYRNRKRFSDHIGHFSSVASEARIPAFNVIGDLNDANVIYHRASGRPVIIDVEDIKVGVLSFDCAWLLTTMARRSCPVDLLVAAHRYVSSNQFLSTKDEGRLMQILLTILLENDLALAPADLGKTRRLLRVARGPIGSTPPARGGAQAHG